MRVSILASFLLVSCCVWPVISLQDPSYKIEGVSLSEPFEGEVRFLEQYPGYPNSLLVLYWHALGRIKISSSGWTHEVIAGSTINGNQDGKGSLAGFYKPSSVRVLNGTTVVLSDSGNSCIKVVDLNTKYARRYAGNCGTRSYSSKLREAKLENVVFRYPVGLVNRKEGVYIADRDFNALLLMSGNNVKQVSGDHSWFRFPTNMADLNGQVFISFSHGLAKYDPTSRVLSQLIGGPKLGKLDGPFQDKMFEQPTSLVPIGNDTLLMADTLNYRIAVISLLEKKVSTICTGRVGFNDGTSYYCNQDYPYSIAVTNSRVFVGRSGGQIHEVVSKILQHKLPKVDLTTVQTPNDTTITTVKFIPTTKTSTTATQSTTTTVTTTTTVPTTPTTAVPTTTTNTPPTTVPIDYTVLRSVGLLAEYDVDCSKITELDNIIIDAQLIQYVEDFVLRCKECSVSQTTLPHLSCRQNLETTWRTSHLLTEQDKHNGQYEIPEELELKLAIAITNFQTASLAFNQRFLDLTIRTEPDRLIIPPMDSYRNLRLKPVVFSYCKSIELVYDEPYDRCVQ